MSKIAVDWRRASTEFVVIVVGVLVALAVDQWRVEKEDRRLEAEYILRIKDDLRADIDNFHALDEIFATKANTIKSLRDKRVAELQSQSPGDLHQRLVFSSFVAMPDSISTTFDELMSTGRFALIQNVEMRDGLSRYYSGFEHISGVMFESPGNFRKVLWESFPAELLQRAESDREIPDQEMMHDGIKNLLADPRLIPAANAEIVYADKLRYYLSVYRRQAEELLELLETAD